MSLDYTLFRVLSSPLKRHCNVTLQRCTALLNYQLSLYFNIMFTQTYTNFRILLICVGGNQVVGVHLYYSSFDNFIKK